jgi:hypothetical protein
MVQKTAYSCVSEYIIDDLAFTYLSPNPHVSFCICFLRAIKDTHNSQGLHMKVKTALLATENDLLVDLTLHHVPASLISEFAEKIVRPYYNGNLNAAIQDLIHKSLTEQDFVLSHITHVRNETNP